LQRAGARSPMSRSVPARCGSESCVFVLARAIAACGAGDVLVVVRLDRLARSVRHLLDVIEQLRGRGAGFRSLADPIDTTTPQGVFSLQVLGAVAELERRTVIKNQGGFPAGRIGDSLM